MIDLPLDHNFPEPILAAIAPWITGINLIPIRRIDGRLPRLGDRELVIALHQIGYRGLVKNNYSLLQNPMELAALIKTKLSVFAIQGVGDDPVRATGALLLDLTSAAKAMEAGGRSVFWLRSRSPRPQDPWALSERTAQQRKQNARQLYEEVRVSDVELATPLL